MFSKPLYVSWPSPAKQQLGVKEATTAALRTTSLTLYFTYESRGTLQSFTLFVTVKTITKLNLGHGDEFEISRRGSCSPT